MQVKTAYPNLVAFIMQRIFYGHVKVLKFSKFSFLKLLFWTGIYCFRSLRAYCILNSIPLSFRTSRSIDPEFGWKCFKSCTQADLLSGAPTKSVMTKIFFFLLK